MSYACRGARPITRFSTLNTHDSAKASVVAKTIRYQTKKLVQRWLVKSELKGEQGVRQRFRALFRKLSQRSLVALPLWPPWHPRPLEVDVGYRSREGAVAAAAVSSAPELPSNQKETHTSPREAPKAKKTALGCCGVILCL